MADRLPFLAPTDLNQVGTTPIMLAGPMRVYTGTKGISLIMEVIVGTANGQHRDWSLMLGKRSFDILQGKLGRDLSKWPGRKLYVERDPSGKFVNPSENGPGTPATAPASAPPAASRADDDIPF